MLFGRRAQTATPAAIRIGTIGSTQAGIHGRWRNTAGCGRAATSLPIDLRRDGEAALLGAPEDHLLGRPHVERRAVAPARRRTQLRLVEVEAAGVLVVERPTATLTGALATLRTAIANSAPRRPVAISGRNSLSISL